MQYFMIYKQKQHIGIKIICHLLVYNKDKVIMNILIKQILNYNKLCKVYRKI